MFEDCGRVSVPGEKNTAPEIQTTENNRSPSRSSGRDSNDDPFQMCTHWKWMIQVSAWRKCTGHPSGSIAKRPAARGYRPRAVSMLREPHLPSHNSKKNLAETTLWYVLVPKDKASRGRPLRSNLRVAVARKRPI